MGKSQGGRKTIRRGQIIVPLKPLLKRSSKWPALRKKHLKDQPLCQACGRTTKLEVHHIRPVHVYPGEELDPENLITLCETPSAFCHYIFGHLSLSWYKWDQYVTSNAYNHMLAVEAAINEEDSKGNIETGKEKS